MTNQSGTSQEGYKVKIVNEDDHPILFELSDKKHWIKEKEEWDVFIDPPSNDEVECKAWFDGIDDDPLIFNVWENRDIKFIIRKDDAIYVADYDGSNEEVFYKFFMDNLLQQSMARLQFSNPCKVKIVNEDDHPILFKIDNHKQWLSPNQEFEVLIDPNLPSTTGICQAWFNGTNEEPWEFSVWEEKDVKFMVRKDDGIYQSDYDGSNEKLFKKIFIVGPEEEPIPSIYESTENEKNKDDYLLRIENQDDHEILFELSHELFPSHKDWIKPSKSKTFKLNYDANFTIPWLCKAWFNGVEEDTMEFDILEKCDIKLMVRKDDGIYSSLLDGSNEKLFIKIKVELVQRAIYSDEQMESLSLENSDFENAKNEGAVASAENFDKKIVFTEYKRYVFSAGEDGALPKCVQIVPSKRKLEVNDKWEEPPPKNPRFMKTYKEVIQFQMN